MPIHELRDCPLPLTQCPFHIGQIVYIKGTDVEMQVVDLGWDNYYKKLTFHVSMPYIPNAETFALFAESLEPPIDCKPQLKIIKGGKQ